MIGYVSPYAPAPAVAPQARPSSRAQSNASYVPPTPSIDNTIVTQDSFSRGMLPLQQPGESNNTPQRVSSDPDPKFDLESFTLFPKLPLELRGMIWKRSFIGRQVILQITSSQVIGGGRVIFQSKGNPPAVLQANTESRSIGLKEYSTRSCFEIYGIRTQ